MTEGDVISVEITISGKTFPLKVTSEESTWIHNMEKDINEKITGYQEKFGHLDKSDCVIMTLLTYAFENKHLTTAKKDTAVADIGENLDDILRMLSVH
ncbi:MAG: cell division protein ZapA [Saprospiraceae bacterium]|nr:cell division protein ZapA [Saprospiraceae bacterium]